MIKADKRRLSISIPVDVFVLLQNIHDDTGLTFSEIITNIIDSYMENVVESDSIR